MADTQFNPLGTSDAPADWILPASLQILLKACFAHFDGSGAAGSYLPTLQIISDSGHTVAEIPMDASVAAGSSVEASWAPFLRSAAGGGGGGAQIPEAAYVWGINGSGVIPSGTGGTPVHWRHFYSTSSTIFGTDTSGTATPPYHNTAGDTALLFNANGAYLVACSVAFPVGAYAQAAVIDAFGRQDQLNIVSNTGATINDLTTGVSATGFFGQLGPSDVKLFYVESTATPGAARVLVAQTSGVNKTLGDARMGIFYLGGPGTDVNIVY